MDTFIQFCSTVALITLVYITFLLSIPRNTHLFIKVGQDVFRWIFLVLVCIVLNRVLLWSELVGSDLSRQINSVAFVLTVIGIVGSVYRHGKSDEQ